jgi:hypothetical protein
VDVGIDEPGRGQGTAQVYDPGLTPEKVHGIGPDGNDPLAPHRDRINE